MCAFSADLAQGPSIAALKEKEVTVGFLKTQFACVMHISHFLEMEITFYCTRPRAGADQLSIVFFSRRDAHFSVHKKSECAFELEEISGWS